jgi:hypothetical protein
MGITLKPYLAALAACVGGRAGLPTITTLLWEAPEPAKRNEQALVRRHYITFTPAGRQITEAGRRRVTS